MNAVFTPDDAERLAGNILMQARKHFQRGSLDKFVRGQVQGQFAVVISSMYPRRWIVQGVENELDYLCRRAIFQGQ